MTSVCAVEPVNFRKIEQVPQTAEAPISARPLFTISSTLEAAKRAEEMRGPCFRPILCPPGVHFMIPIIQLQQQMENISAREGELLSTEITKDLNRLQTLNTKRIETLRLHAKEIEAKQTWSVWQSVAHYVASATSFAIGVGCVSTAGVAGIAGAFLIASGGLGLLNRVMSDTTGWKYLCSFFNESKALQIKNAQMIDSYMTHISMGLAVAGAVGSYYAGASALLGTREAFMGKAAFALATASNSLTVVTRAGMALAERASNILKADLKRMEAESRLAEQEISTDTAEIRKMIELSEAISEVVKQAINSSAT